MIARMKRSTSRTMPKVTGFWDPATFGVQYVVADPETGRCAIVDPVLDFDAKSGSTGTASADPLLGHIRASGLTLEWILETHPHADHFSAAGYLRDTTGAPTVTGARVPKVQKLWKDIYHLPDVFRTDGSQWDRLLADGETFALGNIGVASMFSPGHTRCSVTYVAGDAAFIHGTLFMPDSGSARADFPGGDARQLWRSIQSILALPDDTRLFTGHVTGHDYRPGGRAAMWESTVASQKATNAHVRDCDEAGFLEPRTRRDRTLPMPKLILSALQVNIAGGRLPEPEHDGRRYLKIPIDGFPGVPWQ